jgi:hypothetical protein
MKQLLIIFFVGFYLSGYGQSLQDTSTIWQVEALDGNVYRGKIIRQDAEQIELRTANLGLLIIKKKEVKALAPWNAESKKNPGLNPENQQIDRYFFQSSGYGLRKGEAYYQNNGVLLNQVNVGLTENFSLGIGAVPLFLFGGAPTPIWIVPKVSIPLIENRLNLSVGAYVGTVVGIKSPFFGITYGAATYGSRDNNLTVGMGYGFVDGIWANKPSLSLSGLARVGKRTYVITENHILGLGKKNRFGLLSFGARTVWQKIALDYGLIVPISNLNVFLALPWLGIAVPFRVRAKVGGSTL